ncbi:MAG: DUF285 domain-containing protein, partial [Ekhidna sp.]|nr:DUF285 domain-containing protein [Ekhidna sp.]
MLFITFFGQAQTDPKPFITTWQTTADNETITIPTTGDGYSYTVNWGDGNTDNNITGDASHEYATADTHTVTISGDFPRIYFRGNRTSAQQIRTIEKWGDIAWTSMKSAFYNCDNLTIDEEAGAPNLSEVRNMGGMFELSSLIGDLSKWDVSKVTDMAYMFNGSSFNQDLSKWNTSSVTNMSFMFNSPISKSNPFNGDLSKWDVSKVTNMRFMFGNSSLNQDLSKWDISSLKFASNMFSVNTSMSSENY